MECKRIVSVGRKYTTVGFSNSWRPVYCVCTYVSHLTKQGKWVWKLKEKSEPVIAVMLPPNQGLLYGGLHNKPITDQEATEEQIKGMDQSKIDSFLEQLLDKYLPSDQK